MLASSEEHRSKLTDRLSIHGPNAGCETMKTLRMNLAVHGLGGQIRQANSYYEDPFSIGGNFDYVGQSTVQRQQRSTSQSWKTTPPLPIRDASQRQRQLHLDATVLRRAQRHRARRIRHGQLPAADAGVAEQDIRRKLIEDGGVDIIVVSIGSNFFYTVTLPCTSGSTTKANGAPTAPTRVLFIDARQIYNQIDRAHRDFKPEQIEFPAIAVSTGRGGDQRRFGGADGGTLPDGNYATWLGYAKVATVAG